MSRFPVSVLGASGYTGGELLRLVDGHPRLCLHAAVAASGAGRSVVDVHPGLVTMAGRRFTDIADTSWRDAGVILLALPPGAAGDVTADLPDTAVVVDLSGDHRLRDPAAWQIYYGGPHAATWTYGLPELLAHRSTLAGQTRISNPGCYPTGIILGLAPLLAANLVDSHDIVVVAASGTSGAGRTPRDELLATTVAGQMSAYKVGGTHQHTPEIEQALGEVCGTPVTVSFTPTLAPMSRGILATATARIPDRVTTGDLRGVLDEAYRDEPFVHLLDEGVWPQTGATLGSNSVHLQVAADVHSGRAIIISALDNLVKGAAGQAIQNVNLALGLDETCGLSAVGVTP